MLSSVSYDYSGASVLITGGSNGIGLACAHAYRSAGADVIVTGRKASASDYDSDLSGMDYRQLEVSDREEVIALADSLTKLDVLVNSAGGAQADEWGEGFSASLDVNLASAFYMSTACCDLLTNSTMPGGASVIGIASMTSYFGFEMVPGYGAAKGGLVQLTKTLATSWGKHGIRANAVAAGLTRSNMTNVLIDDMPELIQPTLARQAIERVGLGEDIASAVLFLTSEGASWITGQTLPVDGGFTITMS